LSVKYSDFRNKNINPIHNAAKTEYNSKVSPFDNTLDLAININGRENGNLALLINAVSKDACLSMPLNV
jgi:hypothetical protein